MKILVTAGNTQTPLDRVRCITNIFSGRTGAKIAVEAHARGHAVTFITSHPEVLDTIPTHRERRSPTWHVQTYRTFHELEACMATAILKDGYDIVIHAAAVSDFHVAGVFTHHDGKFESVVAGKVKSTHPELWLKLIPAPKLVDKIRGEWNFHGTLVKFKLEVDVTDEQLLAVAERSRVHSDADLMCANTLDGMSEWAYLGAGEGTYQRIVRAELPTQLLTSAETAHRTRCSASHARLTSSS